MPHQSGNPNWTPGCAPTNPAGRPKGSRNKTTRAMNEIILGAANEVGGIQELVRWYRESQANRMCFWKEIAPRVLPKIIDATVDTEPRMKEVHHYLVSPAGTVVDPDGREVMDQDGQVIMDPLYLEMRGLTEGESEH